MLARATQAEEYGVVVAIGSMLRIGRESVGMLYGLLVAQEQFHEVVRYSHHRVSAFTHVLQYLEVIMLGLRWFHGVTQMPHRTDILANDGDCAPNVGGIFDGSGGRWLVGRKVLCDAAVRSRRKVGFGVVEIIGHQPGIQKVVGRMHELRISADISFTGSGLRSCTPSANIGSLAGWDLCGLDVPCNHFPVLAFLSPEQRDGVALFFRSLQTKGSSKIAVVLARCTFRSHFVEVVKSPLRITQEVRSQSIGDLGERECCLVAVLHGLCVWVLQS